jgi:intein/homing endonuclease
MAEQNLTIFQRMGILLGPNNENKRRISKPQRPVDPLLVTTSPEEFKVTKTELQQQKYVNDLWGKVENDMYARSIHNEPTRMAAYYDFESMEFFPEIAAALDIMSEEACVPSEQGKVLTIFSESERVRSILQDLFNKTLDIETNLQAWTRNVPVRQNSMIPLLNGETITIKELSEKVKNGSDVWTYSIQDETKKIVPGKIIWCDLTRKDSELYRITLDDNTYIETTPDHPFMLRDGSFINAEELKEGDSLMPFYTMLSKDNRVIKNYEKVYDPSIGKYKYTHSVVSHQFTDLVEESKDNFIYVTHHKDFNKLNNSPENLQRMTSNDHSQLHVMYGERGREILKREDVKEKSKVLNHKVLSVVKINETDDVYCMEVVGPNNEQDRHNFPVCSFDENGNFSRNGVFVSNCKYGDNFIYLHLEHGEGVVGCTQLPTIEIERFEDTDLIAKKKKIRFQYKTKDLQFEPFQIAHFRLLGDDRKLPYGTSILEKARRIYRQLVMSEDAMLIYRVVRAPERRIFKVFVGNMEDSDIEAYIQKIANKFKRTPIVDSKTGQIDLRYNQAGIDQDWFVPVRTENAASPIDTLPGAAPLPIDDIEYLQKKLFAAIRVPAPFLGFGEAVGDGKNLSLLDIRFSRTVNRIQKAMIQELNKIAIIHLFMLGHEEELDNFTLALTNPSTQAELLKIELWSQKLDVYSKAMADAGNGFSAISMVRGKKEILGMSDEEIALDLQQQRIEKAAAAELANTASVIPKTGVFDKVDKIYGVKPGEGGPVPAEGAPEAGNEFGGGGNEFGGFGGEAPGATPIGGETEGGGTPEGGTEVGAGAPPVGGPEGAPQESFIPGKHKPLITEKLISKTDSYNRDIKEMIEKIDKSIL